MAAIYTRTAKSGNETMLYFLILQVDKAGFYDIEQGGVVQATIAFNYSRSESNLLSYGARACQICFST